MVCSAAATAVTAQRFILQPQYSLKDLCHGRSILPFVAGLIGCSNIQSSLIRGEWMWKWGLSLLPALVSAGWPGLTRAFSERCRHSHAPVTDQKSLINPACFNYYIGGGVLEVSVQLCLQDVWVTCRWMGYRQSPWFAADSGVWSHPRAGAAWSLPSVHQHLPGRFGWLV